MTAPTMTRCFLSWHLMNLELLERRFSRAASTYAEHSVVQQAMARELLSRLLPHCHEGLKVLEPGAGSGTLTGLILDTLKPAALTVNDLSQAMLEECARRFSGAAIEISYIPGDALSADLGHGYDLLASNALFQWFKDLPAAAEVCACRLKPGGILAFSTFLPGTFYELESLTGGLLAYKSQDEIEAAFKPFFELEINAGSRHCQYFNRAVDVLRHLKLTGVNAVRAEPWPRHKLMALLNEYERRYRCSEGVGLGWQPCYVIGRRR